MLMQDMCRHRHFLDTHKGHYIYPQCRHYTLILAVWRRCCHGRHSGVYGIRSHYTSLLLYGAEREDICPKEWRGTPLCESIYVSDDFQNRTAKGHQLKDIYRRPKYFTTCVFGIAFVLLGNVAPNSISFGIRVLEAADKPVGNFEARGIAIAVVTFACLFHGTWRQGGIYLSNAFAVIKISLLLVIFVTGFVSYSGVFDRPAAAAENFNIHTAFKNPEQDPSGFAESFLAILFAYGGFSQANYVMSEIDNPRKKVNITPKSSAIIN